MFKTERPNTTNPSQEDSDYLLTCEQVSPFIPGNYDESCLPCSAFEWTVENRCVVMYHFLPPFFHRGDEALEVSIMFTLHNGTTAVAQRNAGPHTRPDGSACVQMGHNLGGDPGSFSIAAQGDLEEGHDVNSVRTSVCDEWPAEMFGALWKQFVARKGDLPPMRKRNTSGALACVSCKCVVPAKSQKKLSFSLAWAFPVVRFGASPTTYTLKYAERFGSEAKASVDLAKHALEVFPKWREEIGQWQSKILDDDHLPSWYKSQLFNETYFLTAGGSLWTTDGGVPTEEGQQVPDPVGHFLYLEGMEYRMCVSYDVHFYASFALASLFPLLEKSLTRDVARTISREWSDPRTYLHSGQAGVRKTRATLPHDLGGPTEDPWRKPNIYCIHETSRWKDLPLKFVLMVYRNYVALNSDATFLREMWGEMKAVLEECSSFDVDGRGMIHNEPWPDQTYDAWKAQGVTAYCGGLWLAALRVAEQSAALLGFPDDSAKYADKLKKAQSVYAELWNPTGYYNYDNSKSSHSDSIMADQCCGEWYIRACGLPSVLPVGRAKQALQTVFRMNVKRFGRMAQQSDKGSSLRGAVNGMRRDGSIDKSSLQSMECWAGTTFAVASHMIFEGLNEEAFETAEGIYDGVYNEFGFWFNTPEAWLLDGSFRSLGYMRPLSVWSLQWAYEKKHSAALKRENDDTGRPPKS